MGGNLYQSPQDQQRFGYQVGSIKTGTALVTDENIRPALVYIYPERSSVFSSGLLSVPLFIQPT